MEVDTIKGQMGGGEQVQSGNVVEVLYVHYTPLGIKIKRGMLLLDLVNADRVAGVDPLTSYSYDEVITLVKIAKRPFRILYEETYKAPPPNQTQALHGGVALDLGPLPLCYVALTLPHHTLPHSPPQSRPRVYVACLSTINA